MTLWIVSGRHGPSETPAGAIGRPDIDHRGCAKFWELDGNNSTTTNNDSGTLHFDDIPYHNVLPDDYVVSDYYFLPAHHLGPYNHFITRYTGA